MWCRHDGWTGDSIVQPATKEEEKLCKHQGTFQAKETKEQTTAMVFHQLEIHSEQITLRDGFYRTRLEPSFLSVCPECPVTFILQFHLDDGCLL